MNQKNFENFKKSWKKMSVHVNVRMSKIMRTVIKVDVRTYVRDVGQLSNPEVLK